MEPLVAVYDACVLYPNYPRQRLPLRTHIGSQPSPCLPLVKFCLCLLLGLVAEVPVDPLDHRHGGSPGNQPIFGEQPTVFRSV
jgi:hypothetical protein